MAEIVQPTDLYGNIYIDNIQKAVVICLIIPTKFPFDAGSSIKNILGCMTYVVNPDLTNNEETTYL